MKNNIKKAPVKFREDRLYFQHFMLIFCLCPKSVIVTTLRIKVLHVFSCFFGGLGSALWHMQWRKLNKAREI